MSKGGERLELPRAHALNHGDLVKAHFGRLQVHRTEHSTAHKHRLAQHRAQVGIAERSTAQNTSQHGTAQSTGRCSTEHGLEQRAAQHSTGWYSRA